MSCPGPDKDDRAYHYDRRWLLKELEQVRERGYAVDDEEIEPGLHCIAAPIFNHKRQPQMAISMSFPYGRMWDLDWEQAVRDVLYYAKQTSERLGTLNNNSMNILKGTNGSLQK